MLVSHWPPRGGQHITVQPASNQPTSSITRSPPRTMDSAPLIESTCLKECHSHLKADFFSLFFSSASVCCVYLPYSSDPEHWLPGPFFSFFIFYTILIFTLFTLKRAVLFEILPCYGFSSNFTTINSFTCRRST